MEEFSEEGIRSFGYNSLSTVNEDQQENDILGTSLSRQISSKASHILIPSNSRKPFKRKMVRDITKIKKNRL